MTFNLMRSVKDSSAAFMLMNSASLPAATIRS